MKHKKLVIAILVILLLLVASAIFLVIHTRNQVKDLFRLNKELQEQGYYMGDFEFKMVGILYWLDKGEYTHSLLQLNRLHNQLESKQGLIKMPNFTSKEEEMGFYLNLQNPKTGAFIDDTYPYPTYNEVTENTLYALDQLSKKTGKPIQLKYPLKYLDEINTTEKLYSFLDDTAYVSWISTKFPQTPYVFARSILSFANGEGVIGEQKFYNFSDEWKHSLLQWFYGTQDPKTGFWGPMSKGKNHELLKKDLTNTASIIKAFVDKDGNNLHEEFPLRYTRQMFQTSLEVLSEPIPKDYDLTEWHEWSLKMGKGSYMLLRYLWKDATKEEKEKARKIFENYAKTLFENNYVPQEGAFSYYPYSEYASLDGSSYYSFFNEVGATSSEKQIQLWGEPSETITDLGTYKTSSVAEKDFAIIFSKEETNSLRVYTSVDYNNLTSNVYSVIYTNNYQVLDIIDLTAKMKNWINTTNQSMGNWVSRQEVKEELGGINIETAPIYEKISVENLNKELKERGRIIVIGFDVLQIPRFKMTFEFKK